MSVSRTIQLNDLSPEEVADLFCAFTDYQQAEFFAAIKPIAATWPGAGWCQQSYSICKRLNSDGAFVIETLAGHFADRGEVAA